MRCIRIKTVAQFATFLVLDYCSNKRALGYHNKSLFGTQPVRPSERDEGVKMS